MYVTSHLVVAAGAVVVLVVRVTHARGRLEKDYVGDLVPAMLEPLQARAVRSDLRTSVEASGDLNFENVYIN